MDVSPPRRDIIVPSASYAWNGKGKRGSFPRLPPPRKKEGGGTLIHMLKDDGYINWRQGVVT